VVHKQRANIILLVTHIARLGVCVTVIRLIKSDNI